MKQFLLTFSIAIFGVLLTRVIYSNFFKADDSHAQWIQRLAGVSFALAAYFLWALTGFDPIQYGICKTFPAVQACISKNQELLPPPDLQRPPALVGTTSMPAPQSTMTPNNEISSRSNSSVKREMPTMKPTTESSISASPSVSKSNDESAISVERNKSAQQVEYFSN